MCTVDKYRRFMTTDKLAQASETVLPDSIQTAGHQDRLTDRLTDRLSVVTSLFSTSLGLQMAKRVQMGGRITAFGREELLVRYV
jgi:hypothetical protein